jgi:hypothetical protein
MKSVFLNEYFRPYPDRNLFILGSFARHATLYSQQVRALNLIWALDSENGSGSGLKSQKIGIVGAGAAGITAATAAAIRGAQVWIWEKLQEPMELQQNNRQRWLHPTLYDWPHFNDLPTNKNYTEPSYLPLLRGDDANLPVLTWSAGYATDVARQILDQWESIANSYPNIHRHFNVKLVSIRKTPDARTSMSVEWKPRNGDQGSLEQTQQGGWRELRDIKAEKQNVDALIFATGFGLEDSKHGGTYWDDDAIDSTFHKNDDDDEISSTFDKDRKEEWIISGCGDAALMDLMRICIHGFRQDEFLNLLLTSPGVEGLVSRLKASAGTEIEPWRVDRELTEFVKQKLRDPQPKVRLIFPEGNLFGSKSSPVNQLATLILKILKEPKGTFEIIKGRTDVIATPSAKVVVEVNDQLLKADHVILRHGPINKLTNEIKRICKDAPELKDSDFEKRWKERKLEDDESRRPHWDSTFFADQQPTQNWPDTVNLDFDESEKKYGVWADKLSIYKVIRRDGRSTVTYEINGLGVMGKQPLKAVHFHYSSRAGKVENVACHSFSKGIDVKWKDDVRDNSNFQKIRDNAKEFSGTVIFSTAISAGHKVSFSLSFRLVNGDALHGWEYEQMYPKHLRCHRDGEKCKDLEILSRLVWFPVKKLTIRLTLPSQGCEPVTPSIFSLEDADQIARRDVFAGSVLNYYPARRSRWYKRAADNGFKVFQKPVHQPYERGFFRRLSPRTYELSIQRPMIGSCYSVEWKVPQFPDSMSPDPKSPDLKTPSRLAETFGDDADKFRQALIDCCAGRNTQAKARTQLLTEGFDHLCGELLPLLKPLKDLFMGLMIYDSRSRRLVTIAARRFKDDKGEYREEQGYRKELDFWLEFGLGVAGACFKQANRIFVLNRQSWSKSDDIGFFVRLPDRIMPTFMLEIPMDHPAFHRGMSFPRSQQCIGVLDISSEAGCHATNLESADKEMFKEKWKTVYRQCQAFCDEMYERFFSTEPLMPYTSRPANYQREGLTDYGDGMISIEVAPKACVEIPDQTLISTAVLNFVQQLKKIDTSINPPSIWSSQAFSLRAA